MQKNTEAPQSYESAWTELQQIVAALQAESVSVDKLAEKIEWVSKEKGDGMGFDILSKNNNGTDRFIEVKTTKLAKETPIYFSRTEWKFATIKGNNFYLYRVFNFNDNPQLFIKEGNYESFCTPIVESFKGYF